MPRATTILIALAVLAACHGSERGDAVRDAYDNRADAIENAASAQPTETAQRIYKARADALREEGQDREKGLEGGQPSSGQGSRGTGQ